MLRRVGAWGGAALAAISSLMLLAVLRLREVSSAEVRAVLPVGWLLGWAALPRRGDQPALNIRLGIPRQGLAQLWIAPWAAMLGHAIYAQDIWRVTGLSPQDSWVAAHGAMAWGVFTLFMLASAISLLPRAKAGRGAHTG
jgi:hypothetical protein